ncbi:MAG TPA: YlbF family regulator [Selenomonadales bacterium]|nr:YlbF family regulator [Selenomonadales bacterium]
MNIYDKAHDLARALQASSEYSAFLAAKEALKSDPQTQKLVQDFLRKKLEQEYEAMAGKGEDAAKTEQLAKMHELLAFNVKAKAYLEAYLRFQRVMADISKIIGESVAEGLDVFANDKS